MIPEPLPVCRLNEVELVLFVLRFRMQASGRQKRVRAGRGASLRRSALRADSAAMLGLMAPSPNSLRSLRSLRSNNLDESDHERAARAATSPALLAAEEARRDLPARAFVEPAVVCACHDTLKLSNTHFITHESRKARRSH